MLPKSNIISSAITYFQISGAASEPVATSTVIQPQTIHMPPNPAQEIIEPTTTTQSQVQHVEHSNKPANWNTATKEDTVKEKHDDHILNTTTKEDTVKEKHDDHIDDWEAKLRKREEERRKKDEQIRKQEEELLKQMQEKEKKA